LTNGKIDGKKNPIKIYPKRIEKILIDKDKNGKC
jgi:hypothetical protein